MLHNCKKISLSGVVNAEENYQKKTLQQSSTDLTIDQNHFVNTYMQHIYYLYII